MERIAEGVYLVRGGVPRLMNVYLIEDQGRVTVFDAGVRGMHKAIFKGAGPLGGVKRLVLGHSHADHRGAAPAIAATGVPVFCHGAEVADAEGDGGRHYFHTEDLHFPARQIANYSLNKTWDDGPVKIEGTLAEGDEVAGFHVVHLPGHAPGLIGLHRESDGLMLCSDTIYTLNPLTARRGAPRIPIDVFNLDTELAKASALKLSAIAPKTVWPGHADAITEDVPDVLDELGRKGGVLGE